MVTGSQVNEGTQVNRDVKVESSAKVKLPERIDSISDVIGHTKVDFYPELKRVKKEDILGVPVVIFDAKYVEGFQGDYGESNFYIVAFYFPDGDEKFTTTMGGNVVNDRLGKLLAKRQIPPGKITVTLTQCAGKANNYYTLE